MFKIVIINSQIGFTQILSELVLKMEAEKKLYVLALISGGKDSIFNIIKCVQAGHTIVALANLYPPEMGQEIDSYMYQSVGGHLIENIAEALDKPLYRKYSKFFK